MIIKFLCQKVSSLKTCVKHTFLFFKTTVSHKPDTNLLSRFLFQSNQAMVHIHTLLFLSIYSKQKLRILNIPAFLTSC